MNQNRPTASCTAPPRCMTRKQWAARRRRRRLRILRNWALLLSGCAGAMALMTSGILWLLPKAHAMIRRAGDVPGASIPRSCIYGAAVG